MHRLPLRLTALDESVVAFPWHVGGRFPSVRHRTVMDWRRQARRRRSGKSGRRPQNSRFLASLWRKPRYGRRRRRRAARTGGERHGDAAARTGPTLLRLPYQGVVAGGPVVDQATPTRCGDCVSRHYRGVPMISTSASRAPVGPSVAGQRTRACAAFVRVPLHPPCRSPCRGRRRDRRRVLLRIRHQASTAIRIEAFGRSSSRGRNSGPGTRDSGFGIGSRE